MRWYERLYVGEKAKKHRYEIIQSVRDRKLSGYYILTPASNDQNLLDIYPASALWHPYYEKQDLMIVGVAADYRDAVMLAEKIVVEVMKKTGGYDVAGFLRGEPGQEQI